MSQSKIQEQAEKPENTMEIVKNGDLAPADIEDMDFHTIVHNWMPTVMLSSIFLYLEKKDRLNCKLVCKHWLSVLMTDVYFKKDRHLYLSNCVLDETVAPLSVFENAPYSYNMITIGANVFLGADKWEYFGDNISFLDLTGVPLITATKYVKILTYLPSVRILRVHNDGPIYAGLFGRAMEQLLEQETKLNLEELRIACVNCNPIKHEYFDVLQKIVNVSPKLKKIHIESILERMVSELQTVVEGFPDIKVTINLMTHSETCVWGNERGPIDMKTLELEGVEFSFEKSESTILEKYVETHATVKYISLSTETWPIEAIQDKVVQLDLSLKIIRDYSSIANFPLLENLTFKNVSGCVNVHSPVIHLKVKKLAIKAEVRSVCCDCLQAMMLSFMNLQELTVDHDSMTSNMVLVIFKMLPLYKDLKKFTLNGGTLSNGELQSAFDRLPQHQALPLITDFTFESSQLHEHILRTLCRKFLNARKFSMTVNGWDMNIIKTLRVVLDEMALLKHFKLICPQNLTVDDADKSLLQKALIESGKNLKTMSIPALALTQEMAEEIFQCNPELHSLTLKENIVTRIDNGQVHMKQLRTPHSGLCRVAHPYQRPHQEERNHNNNDDDDDNNHDHHRNFFLHRRHNRRHARRMDDALEHIEQLRNHRRNRGNPIMPRNYDALARHFPVENVRDLIDDYRRNRQNLNDVQRHPIIRSIYLALFNEENRYRLQQARRAGRLQQRPVDEEQNQ